MPVFIDFTFSSSNTYIPKTPFSGVPSTSFSISAPPLTLRPNTESKNLSLDSWELWLAFYMSLMLSLAVGFALSYVLPFFSEMISPRLLRCPSVPVPHGLRQKCAIFTFVDAPADANDVSGTQLSHASGRQTCVVQWVDDRTFETQDCFWIEIQYTHLPPRRLLLFFFSTLSSEMRGS